MTSGCIVFQPQNVYRSNHGVDKVISITNTPFLPESKSIEDHNESHGQDDLEYKILFDQSIPIELLNRMTIPEKFKVVDQDEEADIILSPMDDTDDYIEWVYLLVAPFPTLLDDISFVDLQLAWYGRRSDIDRYLPLAMSESTGALFEYYWGAPDKNFIEIINADRIQDKMWENGNLAIIPFEQLKPRLKIIRIDGISPLEKGNSIQEYPLKGKFWFQRKSECIPMDDQMIFDTLSLPYTNLETEKLTSLIMTGVTALVRSTALKMEEKGMTYPAEEIHDWLISADLTHISNEVSFDPNCPPPNPFQDTLQFCSRPEYMELFDFIDVDVIELTGNHLMDWNRAAFEYSLDLYKNNGWDYYGGGENLSKAAQPLLIEHNKNKFAFIGCNPVGPDHVWATDSSPGNVNCDYEEIAKTIHHYAEKGYLPIFTIQYFESYTSLPNPAQERVFKQMSEAGAVIVSGSQAHFPQTMKFIEENFIHYGLGNLFFDQMDLPVVGTRREFIDRHYFYDGKYINTELLTAMLEDYAQPRPMTDEERSDFLGELFTLSGWQINVEDGYEKDT